MAAKAILIATKTDGTQCVVGDIMPMSTAKAELRAFNGEEFIKVELFDLRQPAKRRKLNRNVSAPADVAPTFEQIVEKLVSGEVVLAQGDFAKNTGLPKVGAFNKAFGTKLDGKAIADIWAKVQELQNAPLMAVGLDALAAELEIEREELDEKAELEGFPDPVGTDEESGEPIYDVEKVREFINSATEEES